MPNLGPEGKGEQERRRRGGRGLLVCLWAGARAVRGKGGLLEKAPLPPCPHPRENFCSGQCEGSVRAAGAPGRGSPGVSPLLSTTAAGSLGAWGARVRRGRLLGAVRGDWVLELRRKGCDRPVIGRCFLCGGKTVAWMGCRQVHPFIRGGKAGAGRYAGAAGAGTGIPGKTGDNWCGCAVLAGKKTGEKRRHRASGRAAEKKFFCTGIGRVLPAMVPENPRRRRAFLLTEKRMEQSMGPAAACP